MHHLRNLLIGGVACALLASPAAADDPDYAALARAAVDAGEHERAASLFLIAHALDRKPDHLYDAATAYEVAGAPRHALTLLRRFLAIAGRSDSADEVRERVAQLEVLLQGLATEAAIQVITIPPEGAVSVDGEPAGKAPTGPMFVPPGRHEVVVTLQGYARWVRVLELAAGQMERLEVTLQVPQPGMLHLTGVPAGATATLDGHPLPPAALSQGIRCDAGERRVRVEAAGHRPWDTTVEVRVGEDTRLSYPAASLRLGYSDWSGAWTAIPLGPESKIPAGATLELSGGASPSGQGYLVRTVTLRDWQRSRCGGSSEVTWKEAVSAQLSLSGGGGSLWLSTDQVVNCSCQGMCRAVELGSLSVVALPGYSGLVGVDALWLRATDAAGADSSVGPIDDAAFEHTWTVAAIDGASPPGPGEVTFEQTHGVLRVSIDVPGAVRVPGRRRGACGLETVQTVRHTGPVQRRGGEATLQLEAFEQVACACEGGCPPARSREALTLVRAVGGKVLVGPGVVLVRD